MQIVDTAEQLAGALQPIKEGASRFTTNWFATPAQVQEWINRRALFFREVNNSLLLFRRDRDFYHIYHAASDYASLSTALRSLNRNGAPSTLAVDLVGRPDDVDILSGIYREGGFSNYRLLCRMLRLCDDGHPDFPDPGVFFAGPEDVSGLYTFLNELLDPLADQIPELSDLHAAAIRREILVVRNGASPVGILLFETAGLTSTLRYWYAGADFRDRGIGGRLMKKFLCLCRSCKRIVLWVIKENADAVAKYRHYGFREEGLVDRIMIKHMECLQ